MEKMQKVWIANDIALIIAIMLMGGLNMITPVSGQSYGGAPSIDVDPIIDGSATNFDEWAGAMSYPNGFNDGVYSNAGTFYFENKMNWNATSSSGNTASIPGVTFFLAHDIWGQPTGDFNMFRVQDDSDWNKAEFRYNNTLVEVWVFADADEQNDSVWLPPDLSNSHLIPEGAGDNKIIDTGFIVRLNNDSLSDRHWFPGDPEPGDPLWDESEYYGVFARAGFDNSFYATGIDTAPAHSDNNEVYEWKITGSTTGQGISPLLHSTSIRVIIKDPPKELDKIQTSDEWFIHLGEFFENIGPHYQDILPGETAAYEIILENPMPEFPVEECKEACQVIEDAENRQECEQECENKEAEMEEDTIILSAENIFEEGSCTWDWDLSHDWVHFVDANDFEIVTLSVTADADCVPSSSKKIKVYAESEKMALRGEEWIDTVVKTTHAVPEFTTIAIPVAAIFGILFLFSRRRKKEE